MSKPPKGAVFSGADMMPAALHLHREEQAFDPVLLGRRKGPRGNVIMLAAKL
jgi:hypothetical protein